MREDQVQQQQLDQLPVLLAVECLDEEDFQILYLLVHAHHLEDQ